MAALLGQNGIHMPFGCAFEFEVKRGLDDDIL